MYAPRPPPGEKPRMLGTLWPSGTTVMSFGPSSMLSLLAWCPCIYGTSRREVSSFQIPCFRYSKIEQASKTCKPSSWERRHYCNIDLPSFGSFSKMGWFLDSPERLLLKSWALARLSRILVKGALSTFAIPSLNTWANVLMCCFSGKTLTGE